jgi:cysteine desulfuration protein SufE
MPAALAELLDGFRRMDRSERAAVLIDYADRFEPVPAAVATRPFPEKARAPRCESEAFVFATDNPDGTIRLHFAVENPQGVSAKAWAAILDETLSGQPLERVLAVPGDAVFDVFGREVSMGKGQGLIGMLDVVRHEAKQRLGRRGSPPGPARPGPAA